MFWRHLEEPALDVPHWTRDNLLAVNSNFRIHILTCQADRGSSISVKQWSRMASVRDEYEIYESRTSTLQLVVDLRKGYCCQNTPARNHLH